MLAISRSKIVVAVSMLAIVTALGDTSAWGQSALGAAATSANEKSVPGKKLDLAFVPADAVALVTVQPRRIRNGPYLPEFSTLLNNTVEAMIRPFNLNLNDMDQVLLVFGTSEVTQSSNNSERRFGIVLSFANSVDLNTVAAKIVPRGVDEAIEKRKARVDNWLDGQSCAYVGDHTLIISSASGLRWMLSDKPGDSPLRKLVAAADDSPEAQIIVAMESLRTLPMPSLNEAEAAFPQIFAPIAKLPKLVNSLNASLSQTATGGVRFEINAVCPDQDSAHELATLVKQLLESGRNTVHNRAGGNSRMSPETFKQIADLVVAALQPTQTENRVEIHAETQSAAANTAVLSMSIAMLLPAVQAAQNASYRNRSMNTLKEIGRGLLSCADKNKQLPARAIFSNDGKPLLSWRVQILPYVGQESLYKQFHLDEPWDSEHNKQLIDKRPEIFEHPYFDKPGMTEWHEVKPKDQEQFGLR